MDHATDDFRAVERALKTLILPGRTFEIRAIHDRAYKGLQGFFDNPETAAAYLERIDGDYKGVYVTLNPLMPDVIHRAQNKLTQQTQGLGATDGEVERRFWLPIDVDPIRVKGISATPTEHKNALKLAAAIRDTLELVYGFPDPILASSGNGAHLVYAIDLPNDDETKDVVKRFIASLSKAFTTTNCNVDTSVFNASRIWRLYGTVARKGDDTLERPHRLSKILTAPDYRDTVPLSALKAFLANNGDGINSTPVVTNAGLYESAYPKDELKWRVLNRAALERVDAWVPRAFGDAARPYAKGFRISAGALGRDLEEDIAVHPWPRGIKDFGEADSGEMQEGRRTPISLLAEFVYDGEKDTAAQWLAARLDILTSEFEKIAAKMDTDDYASVFPSQGSAVKNFNFKSINTASNIVKMKFKPLGWLVQDYLPEGAFFLSSRPKMRKSWWALQLALAVVTGGTFLGKQVAKGEVLALLLEDNQRRVKRRIDILHTFKVVPDLSGLHIWTPGGVDFSDTFPRGADGCEVIREWLKDHPNCKLIIIDTFAHYRGHETGRNQNIYQLDYEAVMPLTRIAAEFGLTLIIVHHERKGSLKESTDFIEDTSGSTGLTGGVDGIIAIKGKRGPTSENEVRQLAITGRDVENDYTINIAFEAELGGWRLAEQQNVAQTILDLFKKYPVLKLTEMYGLMPNVPQSRVRAALLDMRHEGTIQNTANGYTLPFGIKA